MAQAGLEHRAGPQAPEGSSSPFVRGLLVHPQTECPTRPCA